MTTLAGWLATVGPQDAFAALSELMPDAAVFAVDRERNIVMWSRGAEQLLGYSAADVLGEYCLKANRCQQCMVGCGIAEYKAIRAVPLTLYKADGAALRLRKTARAFFDADGEFAGGIEVLVPAPARDDIRAPDVLPTGATIFHDLASVDPAMHRVFQTCRNVAETDVTALIRGESGTGKELIARALHAESSRRDRPFVAVNCAALTPTLMESELFGHVKGAFTGAVRDRDGIFRQADTGTLFLDEVAELPLEFQAKLLRVLEERVVVPVGGAAPVSINVRIIAATHRSLRAEVRAGRFREDLMYRLRVVPIFLPALRERRRDVEVLLWRFIGARNTSGPRVVDTVTPDAMRTLLDYDWPGNVRELKNVVEYAFAVGRGPEISLSDLPTDFREPEAPTPTRPTARHGDEATRIRAALAATHGHIGRAAERLGMSRTTLWRKRKKYGL